MRYTKKVLTHLKKQDELFVFNGYAGADKKYQLPIQVVNEFAWHNLFAQQLFIRPSAEQKTNDDVKPFTIVAAPTFKS